MCYNGCEVMSMGFNVEDVKQSLNDLIVRGKRLYHALNYATAEKEQKKELEISYKKNGIVLSELPAFDTSYEVWYSEALQYVKKFIPDRINDFILLYRNDKRKEITAATYTISDAVLGMKLVRGVVIEAEPKNVLPRLLQQISILSSAIKLIDSVIYSMSFSIRADLFDSELDAASQLLKSGFLRAAGAMCGVVLEKHLSQVCIQHEVSLTKKSPTIGDYNDALKDASVIDLPTWRYIQHLGDLRNLCCHDKKTEPSKEQASDLLAGTIKITKTVF